MLQIKNALFFSSWLRSRNRPKRILIAWLAAISLILPNIAWAFEPQGIPANAPALEIPRTLGTVADQWTGNGPLVVHIQDLHCNYEVQKNIAGLLDFLAARYGTIPVAIEGADRPVNVTKLSTFPLAAVRERVGDYFMRLGKISGAELYAATGQHAITLSGVENPGHYRAARAQVQEFLTNESEGLLFDLRDRINEAKKNLYNPRLLAWDQQRQAFHRGDLSLTAYLRALGRRAQAAGLAGARYPNLNRYGENATAAFPAEVDADRLNNELEDLDGRVRQTLFVSDRERALDRFSRRLDIMEKMLSAAAAPEDLKAYLAEPESFRIEPMVEFLQVQLGAEGGPDPEVMQLDGFLEKAAAFYANADIRSRDFLENLLPRLKKSHAPVAVLITGGYHSPAILASLRAQGVSYLEIRPALTHQDLLNPYFSLLKKHRTPLETLLAQNQRTLALEPFFSPAEDTTRPLRETTEVAPDLRPGYAWMETTLKLDALHSLQDGNLSPQQLAPRYQKLEADYPADNQDAVLDVPQSVMAGEI